MRRAALVGLACAGVAFGVIAEQQAYAWRDLGNWLPDLLAGWTLIGLGIALLGLRRPRGAAVLMLLAGFSWYAFNFENTGPAAVQWLAVHAAYLHRGPLLQLALAAPEGRPRTRLTAAGVALAWSAAVVWPLWDHDGTALILAVVFVGIAAAARRSAPGRRSRAIAGRGLAGASILCAAIAADALRSLSGATQGVTDVTVLGYAAAVALAGVLLFKAAMLDAPAALTERAVALERGGVTLRDALRDLLGDPELEIGFAGSDELVDDQGRPLAPRSADRVATPVTVAGTPVAAVVHDRLTLDDAAIRAAVIAAVGLAAERSRLRREVGRQADAVDASRRRLLLTEEEERRRLAERLERGPGAALADVERLVRETRPASYGGEELAAALDRTSQQLARVRPELDALVRGLGGVDRAGLVAALERLTVGLPVEVDLELADVTVSPEVASALWFVCSESLANAVKHADARSIRVALAPANGNVRISVEDDGRGGANPGGSGLVGLADRVAALGGRLAVVSPTGGGTQVVAELPLPERPY
jgi:signal transduction histidine kinase